MKKTTAFIILLLLVATSASAMVLAGVLSSYRAPQTPNAPTGVTATAGNTQNTVSWSTGATDSTHDPATSYTLYGGTSASPTSSIYSGSATSYTHTGLTNGTPYYYRLTASNAAGTSGYSSPDATATPAVSLYDGSFETATLQPWVSFTAADAVHWYYGVGGSGTAAIVTPSGYTAQAGSKACELNAPNSTSSANIMNVPTGAMVNSTPTLSFNFRIISSGTTAKSSWTYNRSGAARIIVVISGVDASGTTITKDNGSSNRCDNVMLYGGVTAGEYTGLLTDVAYDTWVSKSINVKTLITGNLQTGKTWADVSKVLIMPYVVTDSTITQIKVAFDGFALN